MAPPRRRDDADEAFHRRVSILNNLAADRLEELLAELGARTHKTGKVRVGPCPVHGGNRHNAFNLYPDGHTVRGIWFCKTRSCELVFKKNLLGLVHGVMSHAEHGWEKKGDRVAPFEKARDWLCNFVGQTWADLRADMVRADRARFINNIGVFAGAHTKKAGVNPADVANRLIIPSPYFLGRGFRQDTLERFLVGEPREAQPGSPFFERAVAPVLCPAGAIVLGYTGRSIHSKCDRCGVWHGATPCPSDEQRGTPQYAKWRHHGFQARDTLYGRHLATDAIRSQDEVVLVEGPGKVWRLYEAGYRNAIALFGVNLADPQQAALEALPCSRVTILLDPGEAGEKGAAVIAARLGRLTRTRVIRPPQDPADMSSTDLSRFMSGLKW